MSDGIFAYYHIELRLPKTPNETGALPIWRHATLTDYYSCDCRCQTLSHIPSQISLTASLSMNKTLRVTCDGPLLQLLIFKSVEIFPNPSEQSQETTMKMLCAHQWFLHLIAKSAYTKPITTNNDPATFHYTQ